MTQIINKTWKGIYFSEFIAAWNMATMEGITPAFKDWLLQLEYNGEPIPSEVVSEIYAFATRTRRGLINCAEDFIEDRNTIVIITSAEGGKRK